MVWALILPGSSVWRQNSPKATYLTRLGIRGIGRPLHLQVIALVDPHLDADVALRGPGLGEPVVDLGPERAQGDRPEVGHLGPRHLRAAQSARELNLDAPGAAVHGLLERPLHGPPE